MDFSVETREDLVICRPSGDLDTASAPALREELAELLERAEGGPVVIVLDGMKITDHVGLEGLLDAVHRATATGSCVALVCNDPRILPVLRTTGVAHLVPVAASTDEARDALASGTLP